MTQSQFEYLNSINAEYADQVYNDALIRNYATSNRTLNEYKTILKFIYCYILNDYFNVFTSNDVGFYTAEQAEDLMNRYNELCNTYYWVTPELTDYENTDNIWRDNYIWDDNQIWRD